jgi:hypothetical protein
MIHQGAINQATTTYLQSYIIDIEIMEVGKQILICQKRKKGRTVGIEYILRTDSDSVDIIRFIC